MTVGRDAMEHMPSRPPRRRPRSAWGRLNIFVFGLLVGSISTQLIGWLDLSAREATPPPEAADSRPTRAAHEEAPEAVSSEAAPAVDVGWVGPEAPEISVVEGEIKPNQFVATMLIEAGVSSGEADRAVRALGGLFDPTKSRPGDRYRVHVLEDGRLGRFEYRAAADQVFLVARDVDGSLVGDRLNIELEREVVEVEGEIEHSLWLAFEASGESPALAANLTEVFQFDIDFFHDTRQGDRFRFFVEKYSHRGELVRYGRIFAAEYLGSDTSPVGTKRLYWYANEKTGTRGYYDRAGKAAQRAFLRSPLRFTRISSGYGYRRHPILGRRHFHGGIDYAAPTGTPVRSVADGTVTLAGRYGANGKIVKIKHSGGYESFYLHLSRILVRRGARVGQNTIIGKVGSTGRSTGPHLDFRLKRHGKYLNPRQTVAPRTKRVPVREKNEFEAAIGSWIERLGSKSSDESTATVASTGGSQRAQ